MILPGTARRPLVASFWRTSVADVLPVDRRWPLPLVLEGPCPMCGHVREALLSVVTPERPARN
jgi:hypothetical protein